MIRGGIAKLAKAALLKRAIAGSNPAPASNFAVPAGALTPAGTFNHTAEAAWPSNLKYMASAVSFPRKARTQWTNNEQEKNAASL
jgi:hypothetical protein